MNRWLRLAAAVTAMVMIGNLQYAWTLFVNPIEAKHHWGLSAIQLAFSSIAAIMLPSTEGLPGPVMRNMLGKPATARPR